jgi:hypothetical protein
MTLASKLLARSGARAFFGFAERVPGGFRVHYLPPTRRCTAMTSLNHCAR